MAGQRHPTGYMRRAICDKQKSFSSDPDPPSLSDAATPPQSGTFTEFHFQASGAQASAAGSTCLRDGYLLPAFTRTSRWLSSRPCKLLQFSSWLAFDLESQTYRKRQSGDNLCDRTAVTRRSRATLWRRQAMKTRRGAAKKVKTASEQTPDFRHRGKTSGGGHFQGASVFREMQAFFPSVSRLIIA